MDEQYKAYVDIDNTYKIVDMWDDFVKHSLRVNPDADIDPSHESVTTLNERQFIALIKAATEAGKLKMDANPYDFSINSDETARLKVELSAAEEKIASLTTKVAELTTRTESGILVEKGMESILKLAGMGKINTGDS